MTGLPANTSEREPMNRRLGPRAGAVLAAALDRLIPGDEFGPSATDAGVGHSIEGMLGRADPSLRADWRRSLEQLDDLALARAGAGFAELDEATRDDLLEVVAAGGAPASVQTRTEAPEKHLTSATKSNGISITMPYWDERVVEMASLPRRALGQIPHRHPDRPLRPQPDRFDVVVASNLFAYPLRSRPGLRRHHRHRSFRQHQS